MATLRPLVTWKQLLFLDACDKTQALPVWWGHLQYVVIRSHSLYLIQHNFFIFVSFLNYETTDTDEHLSIHPIQGCDRVRTDKK